MDVSIPQRVPNKTISDMFGGCCFWVDNTSGGRDLLVRPYDFIEVGKTTMLAGIRLSDGALYVRTKEQIESETYEIVPAAKVSV